MNELFDNKLPSRREIGEAMNNRIILIVRVIISILYFSAVLGCIYKAFNFAGSTNSTWTLGVILLTLPLSVVSIFFAWSLLHGAGLETLTVIYLFFALINIMVANKLLSMILSYRKRTQTIK